MLFADLGTARRLEEAQALGRAEVARAHARLRPRAGIAVEAVAGGYAVYNPLGSPATRAHANGLGMGGPVGEADLRRLDGFYRSRGAAAHVDLCPLADPSLPGLLGRRGYLLAGWTNVLARPLSEGEPFAPPPAGIQVRQVAPEEGDVWARIVALGFTEQAEATQADVEIGRPLFAVPAVRCFLGLVDGAAAAGGAVALSRGVATLFGTSTLPAFRGRGLQTALILARLAFAADAGCDLATVNTVPGSISQRNAERQGFRVVYTRALLAGGGAPG
jgi:GNAT superfamily N-acetyltransferase